MTEQFDGLTAALTDWRDHPGHGQNKIPRRVQEVLQDRAKQVVWVKCGPEALHEVIHDASMRLFRVVSRGTAGFAPLEAPECDARNAALLRTIANNLFVDKVRQRQRHQRDCGFHAPIRINNAELVRQVMNFAEQICREEGTQELLPALHRRWAISDGARTSVIWRDAWPALPPADRRRLGEQEARLVLKWLGKARANLQPAEQQQLASLCDHLRTRPPHEPDQPPEQWTQSQLLEMEKVLLRLEVPQGIDRIGALGRATASVTQSLREMVRLVCGELSLPSLLDERAANGTPIERDALYQQHQRARGKLLLRAVQMKWPPDDIAELNEFLAQLKRRR